MKIKVILEMQDLFEFNPCQCERRSCPPYLFAAQDTLGLPYLSSVNFDVGIAVPCRKLSQ